VVIVMSPRSPYDALAQALAAVVRQAVADAGAAILPTPAADTAVMVSVPAAAARLGLGQTKVKKLIASGELGAVMVEGRRLVPMAAIEAYIRRLTEDAS
jgi:excisionase family DNA binding protein